MKILNTTIAILLFTISQNVYANTKTSHAIAMHGEPKYNENFISVEYVSNNAKKGGDIVRSSIGTYDTFNPFTLKGTSAKLRPGALANMKSLLENEYTKMQEFYGGKLFINDALAKAGTSREGSTPNSQHFFGKALDIDISKMSNPQKIKLVDAAKKAGFTGFGFGNTILHIDTGAKRSWKYSNTTFAGKSYAGYWRSYVA